MFHSLSFKNLLSFGPGSASLELQDLNVVIGPNGSGKSNLFDALELLRQAPEQLTKALSDGGGIRDWLWKGGTSLPEAVIDAVVRYPGANDLRYVLKFRETAQRFELLDERVEFASPDRGHSQPYVFYAFQNGQPVLNYRARGTKRSLNREQVDVDRSVLAQRRDAEELPELTYLSETFPKIRIYREWNFGRRTAPRQAQKADLPNHLLDADCANLGLVLNRLRRDAGVRNRVIESLRRLYDGIDDFDVQIESGTVQVFLHEDGITIPATRLSDGTLRYLCLLAILCHPEPPPLVCIEEPELGLHPDILPTVADLIVEASTRCQVIVTTHSDVIVDALTRQPEAVIVCEKVDGQTQLRRLSSEDLTEWLTRYRLGELWTRGELGGTRW